MDMSSFFICFILFLHRMREHNGLITEFLPQCVNRLVELMLAVALLDILGGIKQRKLLARLIFRQQIGSRDREQAHRLVHRPVPEQQLHGQVDERTRRIGGPLKRYLS